MLHTRNVKVHADSTALASSTVSLPPSRLAGVYYRFDDTDDAATLDISNMGRSVFAKSGAVDGDDPTSFAPGGNDGTHTLEPLIHGQTVFSVTGLSDPGTVEFTVFLHFPGN